MRTSCQSEPMTHEVNIIYFTCHVIQVFLYHYTACNYTELNIQVMFKMHQLLASLLCDEHSLGQSGKSGHHSTYRHWKVCKYCGLTVSAVQHEVTGANVKLSVNGQ